MIYPRIPSRLYPWLYIISDLPTKNGDLPTKNCDLPTKNGDLPTKKCDLHTKNGDLPTKNCDFPKFCDSLPEGISCGGNNNWLVVDLPL